MYQSLLKILPCDFEDSWAMFGSEQNGFQIPSNRAAWLGGFTSARARCRRRSTYHGNLFSDHLFSKMGNSITHHICI